MSTAGTSRVNAFLASGNICRLLPIFANSLDQDQARQNVGPDLNRNCLTLCCYSGKNFWKKLIFKKSADDKKKHEKLASMHRVNAIVTKFYFLAILDLLALAGLNRCSCFS